MRTLRRRAGRSGSASASRHRQRAQQAQHAGASEDASHVGARASQLLRRGSRWSGRCSRGSGRARRRGSRRGRRGRRSRGGRRRRLGGHRRRRRRGCGWRRCRRRGHGRGRARLRRGRCGRSGLRRRRHRRGRRRIRVAVRVARAVRVDVHAPRVQLRVDERVVVEGNAVAHGRHVVDRGLVLQDVGAIVRQARERRGEPGAVGAGLHREGAVADRRAGLEGGRLIGLELSVVVVVVELFRPGYQRVAAGAHVEGISDLDLGRALGQLGSLDVDLPDDPRGVAFFGHAPLLGVGQGALVRAGDRAAGQVHDDGGAVDREGHCRRGRGVHRLRAHGAVADDAVMVPCVLAEGAGHGHALTRGNGAVDDGDLVVVEHAEVQRRAARVRDNLKLGGNLNGERVAGRDVLAGRVDVEGHGHDVDADGGRGGFLVLARQRDVADDADGGGEGGCDRDERGQQAGDDQPDNEREKAPDTAWVHVSLHSSWMGAEAVVYASGRPPIRCG